MTSITMHIYTRTGDDGTTGLFGGARVSKDSHEVEALGSVDELNSVLGLARCSPLSPEIDALLVRIQDHLFCLGAELASAAGHEQKLPSPPLTQLHVQLLETAIDGKEAELLPLKNFILPGGSTGAAVLHQARAVCRRAERRLISAGRERPIRPILLVYLNRLSDLLFVLARAVNRFAGQSDVLWSPRTIQG